MKKKTTVLLLTALIAFFSCDSYIYEDEPEKETILAVTTRAADGNANVSYPVALFIFSGDKCSAIHKINSASDNVQISLQAGDYEVYAISDINNYELPEKESAIRMSPLRLKAEKISHGDLMTAHSTVKMEVGGERSLTLNMERKVLKLNEIKAQNIPAAAKSVNVSVSPFSSMICIEGSHTDDKTTFNVGLKKQVDGATWLVSPDAFLLPAINQAVEIAITIAYEDGTTKKYSYKSTEPFKENAHVNILAKYETLKTSLAINIKGKEWDEDQNIEYSFMEKESNPSQGNEHETSSEALAVGDFYKGCYVFAVDADKKKVTVLCSDEKANVMDYYKNESDNEQAAKTALQSFSVSGISKWRVMTEDEAKCINRNITKINEALQATGKTVISDEEYIIVNRSGYRRCKLTAKKFKQDAYPRLETILRPVADVYFN